MSEFDQFFKILISWSKLSSNIEIRTLQPEVQIYQSTFHLNFMSHLYDLKYRGFNSLSLCSIIFFDSVLIN